MSDTPIDNHAMLSDCHSAALVDDRGSVVWWCVPRFDNGSVFGRLLDERAGHFSVSPVGVRESEHRYLDGTLTLESRFRADHGEVVLTEALAMADGVRGHDLGRRSPHRLIRDVLCVASGLVMRYRNPDGLEGEEGAFVLCTFWLARAHALAGNLSRDDQFPMVPTRTICDVMRLQEAIVALLTIFESGYESEG